MLRPDKKHAEAVKGLLGLSSSFTEGFIEYLESDRDLERLELEACSNNEILVHKGRCQKSTDIINYLKSLAAKKGS